MSDKLKDAMCDAIREALGGALDCGRVWSAWQVGTMGEDDFSRVADDAERVAEIADAVLLAMRGQLQPAVLFPALQAAPAAAGVPEPMAVPYGSASGKKDYAYGYEKGMADGWNRCRRVMLGEPTAQPAAQPHAEQQGADELPALPQAFARVCNDGYWLIRQNGTERFEAHDHRHALAQEVYSADQMRAYAESVLAARQPVGEPAMWASSARLAECAAQRMEPAPPWDMPAGGWPGGTPPLTQRNIAGASVQTESCDTPLYTAPRAAVEAEPRPMETAPRDGTMLRLLVQFEDHATEDTDGPAWTIGANSFDNTGEDAWQFAGWCWTHDHFTEGKGKPVAWLPLIDSKAVRS